MLRVQLEKLVNGTRRKDEGDQNHAAANDSDGGFGHPLSEEAIDHKPGRRKQRNQPDQIQEVHRLLLQLPQVQLFYHFIRSISLMFIVSLFLNIAITIPSPTAASAAATVMTKIAKTCPVTCCSRSENAIRLMLTAFIISSIDIRMIMMFRRVRTPMMPIVKSAALSIR